jgi:hypothetical protein
VEPLGPTGFAVVAEFAYYFVISMRCA